MGAAYPRCLGSVSILVSVAVVVALAGGALPVAALMLDWASALPMPEGALFFFFFFLGSV